MHSITISSRPQDGDIFLCGVYIQVCMSCSHSQGSHRLMPLWVAPHSDLVCVALICLPGSYFWVGGCGFVFEDVASGRQFTFQDSSFQISPLFWRSALCVFSSLSLTMYLSHLLFLCIFLSLPHIISSLSPFPFIMILFLNKSQCRPIFVLVTLKKLLPISALNLRSSEMIHFAWNWCLITTGLLKQKLQGQGIIPQRM